MTYQDAISYLRSIDLTMERYERTRFDAYVRKTGLHLECPFVHIAGSNGKGSTASFLHAIFQAAGYKTALFSKPFLYEEREMMLFNGEAISETAFARIIEELLPDIRECGLSAFEALVAIAYTYFNEKKPDLAIVEAGMGGKLDATNLPNEKPLLSIITSVSLEHTRFLGNDLASVAFHKAGIIKNGVPVLLGNLPPEAKKVIEMEAAKRNSPAKTPPNPQNVIYSNPYVRFDLAPYNGLLIPSPALYLATDASMAIAAAMLLRLRFPFSELDIRKGLLEGVLPCRLEVDPPFLYDGAHNPEAASVLLESLKAAFPSRDVRVVFASFSDKDVNKELRIYEKGLGRTVLTGFPHRRAMREEDYRARGINLPYVPDFRAAISRLSSTHPDALVLFTGSLAFASYVSGELRRKK